MKLSKFLTLALSVVLAAGLASCSSQKDYETVKGDPLNARIYTLPNGLKVFMTVNKEEPRVQTYIAVRTGGKNDPAETTGLAHYLEHLMFKGTTNFGTQNYEAEKPLLDQITDLYEVYRTKTDEAERKELYRQIDSISGLAAKFAIPNEYDKLMSVIGASGTNAYTSEDVTCYVENIPSNQIENWAKIQAERFMNPVFRLFHTELESVYEEKNISMTKDTRKEIEQLNAMLYPNHPYGQQTVIGTQEHLKNPSLINIRNYFDKWYVPNNVAICMSGDFDPDKTIEIIRQYFGQWEEKPLVAPTWPDEEPIAEPQYADVLGLEAENVMLAWRFGGSATPDAEKMAFISSLLFNGKAGLFDLDLNQAQRVLVAQGMYYPHADRSAFIALAMPNPGQTLEEARDILLEEVAKLRNGEFDDELIASVITDLKLSEQKQLEDNGARADMFVDCFVNGDTWQNAVGAISRLEKMTKQDIIEFANQHLTDQNFVCIYKRMGEDPNIQRIEKPAITPIEANRDAVSDFVKQIAETQVSPIEPVFVDFDNDLQKLTLDKGQQMLYKKNETNQTFELNYVYDMGVCADPLLVIVSGYGDYLGTSDMMPDALQKALYKLGCSMNLGCSNRRFYVTLSGLDENLPEALDLLDNVLNDAQTNDMVLQMFVSQIQKARADRKLSQNGVFGALRTYSFYGADYVKATNLTDAQLMALQSTDITDRLHALKGYKHQVLYFGPRQAEEVAQLVNEKHTTTEELYDVPENKDFDIVPTSETVVNFLPYTANNSMMMKFTNLEQTYNQEMQPIVSLYNEYFGGSMNSIVFQEMRETRGLAYSANAWLASPGYADHVYYMYDMITTQNDKLQDAYTHFDEIIEQMPESEAAFMNAQAGLLSRMRTERTTRSSVLWAYLDACDLGLTEDPDKLVFEKTQNMTLADVLAFQQQWVKGRKYCVCLVSDPKQVDLKFFQTIGKVNKLDIDEVFGY